MSNTKTLGNGYLGWLGAVLIAIFAVGLCSGQKWKDDPRPSTSPSERPAQIEIQP